MMAKEPSQRFSVPAEVAQAMVDFADEAELAEVIAAIPDDFARLAAKHLVVHVPDTDPAGQAKGDPIGSATRRRRAPITLSGSNSAASLSLPCSYRCWR